MRVAGGQAAHRRIPPREPRQRLPHQLYGAAARICGVDLAGRGGPRDQARDGPTQACAPADCRGAADATRLRADKEAARAAGGAAAGGAAQMETPNLERQPAPRLPPTITPSGSGPRNRRVFAFLVCVMS